MGMTAADDQFHVLAVDDSLIDRKLIERLLKTSSFQVTTVDSGSKALEFLGWHEDERNNSNETCVSPKIHHQEVEVNLVITDYCMPEMTGYDLLKKIKESSFLRDIPVVIMSSENIPSRITRCLEEGAEEFFLKPVRKSDVNKLQEHMMRSKIKKDIIIENEKPEVEAKQENKEIIVEADSDMQQFQTAQSLQQQTLWNNNNNNNNNNRNNDNDNNKRKSMDEGLSPDRTRPRYSDLTVMSN